MTQEIMSKAQEDIRKKILDPTMRKRAAMRAASLAQNQ